LAPWSAEEGEMSGKDVIEIILALTVPIGLWALMWYRAKMEMGLGVRVIQFAGVIFGFPLIVILGLEKILDGQTLAALFGALFGYLLSGIANFDSKGDGSKKV
jgi:hypothetical protein